MELSGNDREKLLLMVSRLEERLRELRARRDRLDSERYAVERLLQLCVEECINIGGFVIGVRGLRKADTYKEIFAILQEAELIRGETSRKLQQLVALRNKLVHMYWTVEREELKDALENAGWFQRFVSELLGKI